MVIELSQVHVTNLTNKLKFLYNEALLLRLAMLPMGLLFKYTDLKTLLQGRTVHKTPRDERREHTFKPKASVRLILQNSCTLLVKCRFSTYLMTCPLFTRRFRFFN